MSKRRRLFFGKCLALFDARVVHVPPGTTARADPGWVRLWHAHYTLKYLASSPSGYNSSLVTRIHGQRQYAATRVRVLGMTKTPAHACCMLYHVKLTRTRDRDCDRGAPLSPRVCSPSSWHADDGRWTSFAEAVNTVQRRNRVREAGGVRRCLTSCRKACQDAVRCARTNKSTRNSIPTEAPTRAARPVTWLRTRSTSTTPFHRSFPRSSERHRSRRDCNFPGDGIGRSDISSAKCCMRADVPSAAALGD